MHKHVVHKHVVHKHVVHKHVVHKHVVHKHVVHKHVVHKYVVHKYVVHKYVALLIVSVDGLLNVTEYSLLGPGAPLCPVAPIPPSSPSLPWGPVEPVNHRADIFIKKEHTFILNDQIDDAVKLIQRSHLKMVNINALMSGDKKETGVTILIRS